MNTRRRRLILAAVCAVALVGAVGFLIARPYVSLHAASPDTFYDDRYFSDDERVRWANAYLDEPSESGRSRLQEAWQRVDDSGPRRPQCLDKLVEPSETMTGNQILTRMTVVADAIQRTPDAALREKLVAATIDLRDESFMAEYRRTAREGLRLPSGFCVWDGSESAVFRHRVVENVFEPAGTATKVMNVRAAPGEPAHTYFVQFVSGKPVLVASYFVKSSRYVDDPRQLHD